MQKDWFELNLVSENKSVGDKYWEIIKNSYLEEHRYYHNFQHIAECIELLRQIKPKLQYPMITELAIWFHDVVYDPMSKTNEQDSNKIAIDFAKSVNMSSEHQNILSQLILGTINHKGNSDNLPDYHYLMDIDLSILGKPEGRFWEYEKQIRLEYNFVPKDEYIKVRGSIMRKFLERNKIYSSNYFRERFELQARENINNLLQRYSNNTI